MMAPALDQVIEENNGKVDLIKIDTDEAEEDLMVEFKIQAMPTVVFYKDGEVKLTKVGMLQKGQIDAILATI